MSERNSAQLSAGHVVIDYRGMQINKSIEISLFMKRNYYYLLSQFERMY